MAIQRIFRTIPLLATVAAIGAAAGLLYAELTGARSLLAGSIYGAVIAVTVLTVERGLVFRRVQQRMRQWPTFIYVPVMEVISVVLALVGFAIGGAICWTAGLVRDSLADATIPTLQALIYSLLIAAVLVSFTRMRDLLGHEVFKNLLLGRYHRPVEERRIFLFLDVVGSTAFARCHGDLRAQSYLAAVFAAIAEPVRQHGGSIDDYIGDMAMITWPEPKGIEQGRCVACVFAILSTFEANRSAWLARFGHVPEFHAALHGGNIVTAEIGIDRHKISYFGDVVNTTARIEALCRQLGAPVLVSAELLARIPTLPAGIRAFPRGEHILKGLDHAVGIFSLKPIPASDLRSVPPPVSAAEPSLVADQRRLGLRSAP